jgi:hypothetical protein
MELERSSHAVVSLWLAVGGLGFCGRTWLSDGRSVHVVGIAEYRFVDGIVDPMTLVRKLHVPIAVGTLHVITSFA